MGTVLIFSNTFFGIKTFGILWMSIGINPLGFLCIRQNENRPHFFLWMSIAINPLGFHCIMQNENLPHFCFFVVYFNIKEKSAAGEEWVMHPTEI